MSNETNNESNGVRSLALDYIGKMVGYVTSANKAISDAHKQVEDARRHYASKVVTRDYLERVMADAKAREDATKAAAWQRADEVVDSFSSDASAVFSVDGASLTPAQLAELDHVDLTLPEIEARLLAAKATGGGYTYARALYRKAREAGYDVVDDAPAFLADAREAVEFAAKMLRNAVGDGGTAYADATGEVVTRAGEMLADAEADYLARPGLSREASDAITGTEGGSEAD